MEPRRTPARRAGLVALAALLAFGASACGSQNTLVGPSPAASVNGTEITQSEVFDAVADARRFYEYSIEEGQDQTGEIAALVESFGGTGTSTLGADPTATILTDLIRAEILRQELADDDALPTKDDIAAVRDEAATQLGGAAALEKLPQGYLNRVIETEALVQAFTKNEAAKADERTEPLTPQEREEQMRALLEQSNLQAPFCFQVIEASTADAGAAARSRVDAGEDFVAVSRDVSPDGSTIPDGGVVGCLGLEQASQLLGQDVTTAKVGDVIGPASATLEQGADPVFLVIKVSSLEGRSYEEALPQLEQAVPEQPAPTDPSTFDSSTARADVIARADVVVSSVFGTWRPALGSVTPPRVPGTTTTTAPVTDPAAVPVDAGS